MVTKEIAIKEIKDFAIQCKLNGLTFSKIFFFGSTLHSKANEYSDIDVLLFSDQFTNNIFENTKLYAKPLWNFYNLDVKAYPTAMYDFGNLLIDEVKKNGLEIKID